MAWYRGRARSDELDMELRRDQEHELEVRAERYAELHAPDEDPPTGSLRRALRRLRAALDRRS